MSHRVNYSKESLYQQLTTGEHRFVHRGDLSNAYDYTQATLTMDGAWHELDISAIVPVGTVMVTLTGTIKDAVANKSAWFAGYQSTSNGCRAGNQVANLTNPWNGFSEVVNQKIQYWLSAGIDTFNVAITGWFV